MHTYAVFGAGMQGRAAAYDLAIHGDAEQIIIIDRLGHLADDAAALVNTHSQTTKCIGLQQEIKPDQMEEIVEVLESCDAALSCVPFIFNEILTSCCIQAKCHFNDLGGNTEVVMHQMREHGYAAKEAGVSIVPDCGIAPGAVNVFAALLIKNGASNIKILCGGIPEEPEKCRLAYKKTFAVSGLLNEYDGNAIYLRNGKIAFVPTLAKDESHSFDFELPGGLGTLELEAAPTSGGTSTAPYSFEGDIQTYEYRTLRYREGSHFDFFRNLKALGLLNAKNVTEALEENLDAIGIRDRIVLQIQGDENMLLTFTCLGNEFTAMEQATGFSASIVTIMQAKGLVKPGAKPIELAVDPDTFLEEFCRRFEDIDLQMP